MKIAIQADMLPGRTPAECFTRARDLGFDGVDLWATGLDARLYTVASALNDLNLPVASVHLGQRDGYLSPQMAKRETAIGALREAMATAVDLQVEHVVFVPQWGAVTTPDLTPYRSAGEMAGELMIWLLRTVSDLAYALGTTLHMQPRHRYDTSFLTTVAQAARYCKEIDDHAHVRIAPSLFAMALEEDNLYSTLTAHAERIGYLYLADSNGRLPGQGLIDFERVAEALADGGYDGWLCLSTGQPVTNPEAKYAIYDALPASLQLLEAVGLRD